MTTVYSTFTTCRLSLRLGFDPMKIDAGEPSEARGVIVELVG